jgi:phosphate starvation-inducible PhoH-like protein
MRGRTFKRCFILADEMQNSSPTQLLMATTRIGCGSKMVVNGDLNQSDRGVDNGLAVMVSKIRSTLSEADWKHPGIALCDMDPQDIERSAIVSAILRIMNTPAPKTKTIENGGFPSVPSKNESDAALIPYKDLCRVGNDW